MKIFIVSLLGLLVAAGSFGLAYYWGMPKEVAPKLAATAAPSSLTASPTSTPAPSVEPCLNCKGLTSLAEALEDPAHVSMLTLNDPTITAIPPSIEALEHLFVLNIGNTKITTLPSSIGKLKNLQILLLTNNQLKSLPAEISQLEHLQALYLQGNQFSPTEQERIRKLLPDVNVIFSAEELISPTPQAQ